MLEHLLFVDMAATLILKIILLVVVVLLVIGLLDDIRR